MAAPPPADPGAPPRPSEGFFKDVARDLRALGASPPALWVIYAVKFLESVAYFIVLNLAAIYLRADLGYTDVQAGALFGAWATAISLATFFSGFIADALGVRRAMLVSLASCILGRAMLAFGATRGVAVGGLFVMTWGVASMVPTMTAAVRQYTTRATVSFGFSLFYVTMNVGALVAPLAVGWFRRTFERATVVHLPAFGALRMSSSQLVFTVGLVATLLSLALVLGFMKDDAPHRAGDVSPPAAPPPRRGLRAVLADVLGEATFWRFMLFVTLLVLVRLVFQHAHQTWPAYTLREFGERFPFAYYWSINPLMIIFVTPVVTALTRERSAFWCIVSGALVTAASVFALAVSTTVAASVAFIVLLSLGEALWSPRLYEYTATIAPRGREASYMGLSSLPMFFAKMVVGGLSGVFLARYCPATGPRQSQTMWLLIGLMTLAGPLLIVLLRNVIAPRSAAPKADAEAPTAEAA